MLATHGRLLQATPRDFVNALIAVPSGSARLTGGRSGDSWITMGMYRIKKQGTFDLDYEFNKVAWDGSSGIVATSRMLRRRA